MIGKYWTLAAVGDAYRGDHVLVSHDLKGGILYIADKAVLFCAFYVDIFVVFYFRFIPQAGYYFPSSSTVTMYSSKSNKYLHHLALLISASFYPNNLKSHVFILSNQQVSGCPPTLLFITTPRPLFLRYA